MSEILRDVAGHEGPSSNSEEGDLTRFDSGRLPLDEMGTVVAMPAVFDGKHLKTSDGEAPEKYGRRYIFLI